MALVRLFQMILATSVRLVRCNRWLLIPGVVLPLTACKLVKRKSSLNQEFVGGVFEQQYELGSGYYSVLGQPAGEYNGEGGFKPKLCMKGKQTAVYRTHWDLKSTLGDSQQSSSYLVNITGWATGNLGVAKISGNAEIGTALDQGDTKITYYTDYSLRVGNIVLEEASLTDEANQMTDSFERLLNCGDEYIYQAEYGARIYAGIEFSFSSRESKNQFQFAVSARDALTNSKIAEIKLPSQSLNLSALWGTARIVLFQQGGNQEEYNQIQREIADKSCVFKAEAKTATSTGNKVELVGLNECLKYYQDKIVPYVKDRFVPETKDLASVIGNYKSFVPLRYFTKRYRAEGLYKFQEEFAYPDDLKPAVEEFRSFLQRYREFRSALRGVKNTLDGVEFNGVVLGNEFKGNLDFLKTHRDTLEGYVAKTEQELGKCIKDFRTVVVNFKKDRSLKVKDSSCLKDLNNRNTELDSMKKLVDL